MSAQKLTVTFDEIDKDDLPLVGGKGANLGEMTRANFPVPAGFAVTVEAYDKFIEENSLFGFINDTLKATDVHDPKSLEEAAKSIQSSIERGDVPDEVGRSVIKAYEELSQKGGKLVAVRSSATAEDLPGASFAGQQATFLNVEGEANLVNKVRSCWASLFTARAIFYREENNIAHEKVKISVIVQRMVQSDVSGVMFTVDPVTNDKSKIMIEAVWGLGELIVQGSVVPDRYMVKKQGYTILSKEISDQSIMQIREGKDTKEVNVPEEIKHEQKLTDGEVVGLAKIGDRLQKHYYFPQDVEWAKDEKGIFIVQTRPVTTIKEKSEQTEKVEGSEKEVRIAQKPILEGSGASPGIGTGHVKVLESAKEIGKVEKGDVLVSTMTSPDFVPAMKRASAIVTDEGGQTSHAAIVSRELGIPCIVGTREATQKLKDEMVVTVDGTKGAVYMGSEVKASLDKKEEEKKEEIITQKTATKLYVNLAEPELAAEIAKKNIDGVGLLRAEFMIANIGIHPKEAIKKGEADDFVAKLAKDITSFCEPFGERPVVYRATDFKTNEYRQLPGGKHWEPEEPNPMLGYRGAFRYLSDPEVFKLELEAIKRVRQKHKNLWMMIPYVRSPEELARVRKVVAAEGLFKEASFKFWMMVELPVNVISLKDFIDVGIDGVSIGSNDLTMLTVGTDRDNAEVAEAYDERSPAVEWSLKRVVKICGKEGVTSSICGQAASDYDELVEKLVKNGVTSVSVNPDAINRVRRVLVEAEKKFAKGR